MLLVLLVRGLTLPGAGAGIKFYLYPDISRLEDPQVLQGGPSPPQTQGRQGRVQGKGSRPHGFFGSLVHKSRWAPGPQCFSTGLWQVILRARGPFQLCVCLFVSQTAEASQL